MSATFRLPAQTARPEEIALDFMRRNPPIDLDGLVQALGLPAVRYVPMASGVAGKIERVTEADQTTYQISVNSEDPPTRQRFTLAHEIGHFIKHRRHLDQAVEDTALYRSRLPEPMEWEANRYAATLLMPLSAMRLLYKEGLREPRQFAKRLGVSEEAASIRLQPLKMALQMEFGA